jgi:spore coat protein H
MRAVLIAAAFALAVSVQAQKQAPATRSQAAANTAAGDKIFDLTRVHRLRISISAAEWAVLMTSGGRSQLGPGGSDYKLADGRLAHLSSGFANYLPWAHADLRIDDADGKAEFKDIGIRYKGNSSFTRSSINAPLLANFKLKIDLHGTKGTWDGEKTFNLQSGVVDGSRMRDAAAYWIFRMSGVPAPRTTYAEVFFNVPGVYQDTSAGLFTIIEDVNKKFLERVLPKGDGLLMKPEQLGGGIHRLGDSWAQYAVKLRPDRDATPYEQRRVMEFSELCSQTDVALFRSKVGTYLDVDEFLRFIAVNSFIGNWDSYLGGGHNFYLYLDPSDDKFRFIPWDQDLSMQSRGGVVFRVVQPNGAAVNGVVGGNVMVNGNAFAAGAPAPGAPPTVAMPGSDILNPAGAGQPLIYWLLDDPAVAARYRAIIRELSATAFSAAELTKLMDALEAASPGRTNSPREFMMGRANMVQQLVAGWQK